MSLSNRNLMLMRCREAKDHGTKRCAEDEHAQEQTVLDVEDLVRSSISVMKDVQQLRDLGWNPSHVFVVLRSGQVPANNLFLKILP